MLGFYAAASGIVILIILRLLPWMQQGKHEKALSSDDLRRQLNLKLHDQRAEALLANADSTEHEALCDELNRDLLDVLEKTTPNPSTSPDADRKALKQLRWGMAFLLLAGLALYGWLGRYDLATYHAGVTEQVSAEVVNHEIDRQMTNLKQRLVSNPDDLEGWLLLSRSLMMTGRFLDAIPALEQAIRLDPENPDLKIAYADAWAETHKGDLSGKPEALINEVLAKYPQHQDALWMSGMLAVQQKRIADAVAQWRKLQMQLPVSGEDHFRIESYIARIQGLPLPVPPDENPGAPASAAIAAKPQMSIEVEVTLDEKLRHKLRPEDTLFIFARAASGPPMPLAIVRRKAGELPLTVKLDDTMAMAPGMDIRSFSPLVMGARISHSGQAKASSGDLQGLSLPKVIENGGKYPIIINEQVP